MTRTSKFVRWLLCGFAAIFIIAIGAFIVWRVNLAREVDVKLAAIRAAGLPTNGKELNDYYPAVPDNENAALVLTQAFALIRNLPDRRSNDEVADFKIPPRGQSLTAEQKQFLSGYVAMNEAALAKATEALKLPRSRYPVDFSPGLNTQFFHLGGLRKLCGIAEFQSLLATDSSNPDDLVASITGMLGMARTLDEEPDWLSQFLRGKLINMASTTLEYCLNVRGLSETSLVSLSPSFAAVRLTNLVVRAFIGERAKIIPYFQSRSAWVCENSENELIADPPPMKFWILGVNARDLVFYLKVMDTNIAFASHPFPRDLKTISNFSSEVFDTVERHPYTSLHYHHPFKFSATFLPSIQILLKLEAEYASNLRLATAALAVERFRLARGELPEKLNELVPQFLPAVPLDPFDGQPLRYHRLEKGYLIYSIGSDGHDDGGRGPARDLKSNVKPGYDITYTVER
jgi:hypothetical protein